MSGGTDRPVRPAIAPPDEDPNATILCRSPPCFLHELDPTYLGYLGQDELRALLGTLLAETGRLWTSAETVRLREHLARLGGPPGAPAPPGDRGVAREPAHARLERLAHRLRDALPRLQDETLRHDLVPLLERLQRVLRDEPQDWAEVRAWRKTQRETLIAQRLSVAREERGRWNEAIAARLARLLPVPGRPPVIGMYWPFRGEFDPRPLMRSLHGRGIRIALPVVIERGKPLLFRDWWPGIRMEPGIWDIPVPAEGDAVLPAALVVPLVGFDGRGYRLGYGGGYYDRTLAAMPERPLAIGVGFALSRLETIHPQPHDIPMDLIVTEQSVHRPDDVPAAPGALPGNAGCGRQA